MATLDWIGKKAVLNYHRSVPFHLLRCNEELSVGDPGSGNLLVQGDNLLALKALLPYYAGKIQCIYIDPPYNTGNEGWVYNDNVNSPEMLAWLGKVVGKEAEDLSRHDKWLCMMYPRLMLLREFLRDDGVIMVSIDDTEAHSLRMLMDEIFGPTNWMSTLIWKRRLTPDSRNLNGISSDHEYVLCYGRTAQARFKGQAKDLTKYTNPDNDPRGPWMSDNMTGLANANERPNLHYDIIHPITGHRFPPHPSRGWLYGQERMAELIEHGQILWPKSASGRPRLKRYLSDMKSETTGFSSLLDAPANVAGTKELGEILGPKVFAFPKPSGLIELLIDQVADPDAIIMDSFAGSATTGQAVMNLNKSDGGRRRFILVEMEPAIARWISRKRLERVINGYSLAKANGKTEVVEGLGGGVRYCELEKPLFTELGQIRAEVSFMDLARHVFFTETGEPLPTEVADSPLLGVVSGVAVYLLFAGSHGDLPGEGNIVTPDVLRSLPPHAGPKVIFGDGCTLSAARQRQEGIIFKQIPYQVKVG